MGQQLDGKRVLVTGGTRGIGRAAVLAFAERGARVVTCHRTAGADASRLVEALARQGGGHQIVRADVTDAAGAEHLLSVCRQHLGGLDVLVNNVGADGQACLEDLDELQWHQVLNQNLTSAYLVTRAALSLLAEGASIVNVGSAAAVRGRPAAAHYVAAKAAMIGLTRGLCKELGPRQIRVNAVAPGVTSDDPESELPPHVYERLLSATALRRLCRPQDVADAVLFLAGDEARCISGATLTIDGGV